MYFQQLMLPVDIITWNCPKRQSPSLHLSHKLISSSLTGAHSGLAQAPAYFQRLVNKILVGIKFAFGYLDDILVFSPDVETHLKHLQIVFQRLREADLKLHKEKCSFFKRNIQYLGHIISEQGIEPVTRKTGEHQKHACTKDTKGG